MNAQPPSEDSTVTAVSSCVSTSVDGEKVLLEVETGTYYGLQGVGPKVWELVQKPTTVREVQKDIIEEYDVDPQECREHVLEFLAELRAAGLVRVHEN